MYMHSPQGDQNTQYSQQYMLTNMHRTLCPQARLLMLQHSMNSTSETRMDLLLEWFMNWPLAHSHEQRRWGGMDNGNTLRLYSGGVKAISLNYAVLEHD